MCVRMKTMRIISGIAVMILFCSLNAANAEVRQMPKHLDSEEQQNREEALTGLQEQKSREEQTGMELQEALSKEQDETNQAEMETTREHEAAVRQFNQKEIAAQEEALQEINVGTQEEQ